MADRTTSPEEARQALANANNLIATAVQCLAAAEPVLRQFTPALLDPVYRASLALLTAHREAAAKMEGQADG